MRRSRALARRHRLYVIARERPGALPRRRAKRAARRALADPDRPRPSVYVATSAAIYNEVFLWGPRNVRRAGPAVLRNVVGLATARCRSRRSSRRSRLTPGPATGPRPRAQPAAVPAPRHARAARLRHEPARLPLRRPARRAPTPARTRALLHALPGRARRQRRHPGRREPGRLDRPRRRRHRALAAAVVDDAPPGAPSPTRACASPTTSTPMLVGNLGDLSFDGQTRHHPARRRRGPGCHYVGNATWTAGEDRPDLTDEAGPKRSSSRSRRGSCRTRRATTCARSPPGLRPGPATRWRTTTSRRRSSPTCRSRSTPRGRAARSPNRVHPQAAGANCWPPSMS